MDLIDHVTETFKADRARAEKGVGAVLSALRTTMDKDSWEKLKKALPNAELYVGRSMMVGGGRTAEMAPIVAPSTLLAALATQGWPKDDIPRFAMTVIDAVRAAVGPAAVDKFLAAAPGLRP
jgi:hypothetical protein